MSERLPVVSGAQLINALRKAGWVSVRQRGSHVRLKHSNRAVSLVVPLHRELKRGTLAESCATPESTATSYAACFEGTTASVEVISPMPRRRARAVAELRRQGLRARLPARPAWARAAASGH